MVSRPSFQEGFGAVPGAGENQIQQIDEDQDVDDEQADADPGDVAIDLEEFPGKERSRNGESEELAPGLFKIEANAFSQGDGGIAKGEESNAAQEGIVNEGGFIKDEADEARLGIEAQMAGEEVDFVGQVLVQESMGADADGDEEQSVEEFINRYEKQKAIVGLAMGAI
jgi:hypothetical protein